ncbi:MAG: hypothetical protein LCH95_12880 [Proteobacteria bacterium]|nr:hypothetical protein [Pseudomonadota bacterium]
MPNTFTGKDLLDIAAGRFGRGEIDCLCIVGPRDRSLGWIDTGVTRYLEPSFPVRKQALLGDAEPRPDVMSADPQPPRALRVLALGAIDIASRAATADRFIRSGTCMMIVDDAETASRCRSLPAAHPLRDIPLELNRLCRAAAFVVRPSRTIALGWVDDTARYCHPCAARIMDAWKGWPLRKPLPLLPVAGDWGCESCGSTETPTLSRRQISWINVHGIHNTGLPDFWALVPRPDLVDQWGMPYAGQTVCPLCRRRAVLSEHSEHAAINCGRCGLVDPHAPAWRDDARSDVDGLEAFEHAAVDDDGPWRSYESAHPQRAQWIAQHEHASGFAADMRATILRRGGLRERQVRELDARMRLDEPNAAEMLPDRPWQRLEGSAIHERYALLDVGKLGKALARAGHPSHPDGPAPRLTFGRLVVTLGRRHPLDPSGIYWSRNGLVLGKVREDSSLFLPSRAFTELPRAEQDALLDDMAAICADPPATAARYGRESFRCPCCDEPLTSRTEIERGIHLPCASRFFRRYPD